MLDDVCAAYDALRVNKTPRLPMVRLQYPDFATWQSKQLQSTSLLRQVSPSLSHASMALRSVAESTTWQMSQLNSMPPMHWAKTSVSQSA